MWWRILEICLPVLLGVGCVLIIAGIRGVRRGSAPHCAGCEFDLSGSDLNGVCPECGIVLSRKGRWRHGSRRRMPLLVVLGLLLTLPCCMSLTYRLSSGANAAAMARYKPMWLLRSDIAIGGTGDRLVALGEVQRRIVDPNFTDWESVQSIVRDVLAIQADSSKRWDREMGDLVLAARAAGHVPDEDFARFIANGSEYTLRVPKYVRAGELLEIQVDADWNRAAQAASGLYTEFTMGVGGSKSTIKQTVQPFMFGRSTFSFMLRAPAASGAADLNVHYETSYNGKRFDQGVLTQSVEVIALGAAMNVHGVVDPAVRAELVAGLAARVSSDPVPPSTRQLNVYWSVPKAAQASTIDFVCNVVLRGRHASGQKVEVSLGRLQSLAATRTDGVTFSLQRFDDDGTLKDVTLEDVLLQFDKDVILATPGVEKPWLGEDIVVPLEK